MKVLKFGGTSVGTVESLKNVKQIVESIPDNAIIVVSALGGLTDKLIATASKAAKGDVTWRNDFEGIKQRHYDIIDQIVPVSMQEKIFEKVNRQLDGLKRNYEGVELLRSLPEKTLDTIVSFGERMSSVIVAAIVENGKRYFSPDFIKTEKWYGRNNVDATLTNKLIKETFSNLGKDEKAIVPGFISTDKNSGEITNLGRGGSDYTGALIASALDAEVLEIWTDVDGFMTADPRMVKDALIIDHLSFSESMELCTFGAKVIYPPTIYPVFHKNIPIKILNTFHPEAPGTLITEQTKNNDLQEKGVTPLKGVSLISIDISTNNSEIQRRAYYVLSRQGVMMIPLLNSDSSHHLDFAIVNANPKESYELLKKEFSPELNSGAISKIVLTQDKVALAVVGKNMKSKEGLGERIRHSLNRAGIHVDAISPGNSDTTLIYIINQEKSPEAVLLIHSLIFKR